MGSIPVREGVPRSRASPTSPHFSRAESVSRLRALSGELATQRGRGGYPRAAHRLSKGEAIVAVLADADPEGKARSTTSRA